MGANPKSAFFYNRVKGEMERALKNSNLKKLVIIRPSLITGDRKEKRFGESFAKSLMKITDPIIPLKYRSVSAKKIANAMYRMTLTEGDDIYSIDSGQIHKLGEQ
jgi:uncharacterized protein YbjT (DUF2867 family)